MKYANLFIAQRDQCGDVTNDKPLPISSFFITAFPTPSEIAQGIRY